MRIFGVFALILPLAGCAGSLVGDAIAGPEKLAAQDDAYCQSIGTRFGTSEYANCRMVATQIRENRHAHRMGVAAQGMAIATKPAPAAVPSTTRCQRIGVETVCNTY